MRKVDLKMNEKKKYEVIKAVVEKGGNKTRAAVKLGCSRSSIYRMIKGYESNGKEYFSHGNNNRKPGHALSKEFREKIISLYNGKYWDASYTLFSELLRENEEISISPGTVRNILMGEYILSPLATKKTKRRVMKELSKTKESGRTKKETAKAQERIVAIHDAHPNRPRKKYFGEMLQMDASQHRWFAGEMTHLHIAIDDSSGTVTGAYFDKEETLKGYYQVLYQTLEKYGIPYSFLTDNRTVFNYAGKTDAYAEKDTFTQFGYACKQLGVDLKTSSIPQKKGRVERAFGTLQNRLPILLRLAGCSTLEQANVFLRSYLEKYNQTFALSINSIPSVFEKKPQNSKLDLILAVIVERTIDKGHCVRANNQYYKTINSVGTYINLKPGSKGLLIKAFDGKLYFSSDEKVYALKKVPAHFSHSEQIDMPVTPKKPKRIYIPPMSHPWKTATFDQYKKREKVVSKDIRPIA